MATTTDPTPDATTGPLTPVDALQAAARAHADAAAAFTRAAHDLARADDHPAGHRHATTAVDRALAIAGHATDAGRYAALARSAVPGDARKAAIVAALATATVAATS